MKSKNNKPFQMRVSSINVLKFFQNDVKEFDTNRDDIVEYQSDFRVKVLEDLNEVGIESTVKLKIQEINEYFGELKVLVKFNIIPFDGIIFKENNGYKIPDQLLINLFDITTSTVRGILYERLKGTVLQNEIFPLIDLSKAFKSQIEK